MNDSINSDLSQPEETSLLSDFSLSFEYNKTLSQIRKELLSNK